MAYKKLPGIDHGNKREYADDSSPFEQTKSGRGNIFTTRGRNQRLVNKHTRATENLEFAEGIGSIYKDNTKNIEKYRKKKQKLEKKMSDQPKRIIGFAKDKRIDVHDDGTYSRRHRTHRGHGSIEIYDEEIIPRTKRTLLNEKIRKNKHRASEKNVI